MTTARLVILSGQELAPTHAWLDKDFYSTPNDGDGSHDFHWLDLPSSAAPRCPALDAEEASAEEVTGPSGSLLNAVGNPEPQLQQERSGSVELAIDESSEKRPTSQKKIEANRLDAQKSSGPRTPQGKANSRRNALKHGILASGFLITEGEAGEDPEQFERLLKRLTAECQPVGAREEMLVERIAICYWRQNRAFRYEATCIRRVRSGPERPNIYRALKPAIPAEKKPLDPVGIPLGTDLDSILRDETAINRQLAWAINELERLQRARKGEHVPAPVNLQVSNE